MDAMFQSLESRKLLAAAVTATLSNGNLRITGTESADTIFITDGYDEAADARTTVVYNGFDTERAPIAAFVTKKIKTAVIDLRGGNDTLVVEDRSNAFYGAASGAYSVAVSILGGDGNDAITTNGIPSNVVDGGSDDDTIFSTGTVKGGTGNDTILGYVPDDDSGYAPAQNLDGGDGRDTIRGQGGSDTITGGAGDDVIYTSNSSDRPGTVRVSVDSGAGNDKVYLGSAGTVHLGSGNDRLFAQYLEDDDVTFGGITAYGDDGNDYLQMLDPAQTGDTVHGATLVGGTGNDSLSGGVGNDDLQGQAGNDEVRGNGGNDSLTGGTGNDLLYGGDGNDTLYGGADRDTLTGGGGNNRLYGQGGVDTIHSKNGQVDQIFASGDGDVLDRDAFDVLKTS